MVDKIPPPLSKISKYETPCCFKAISSSRDPPKTRWVWESTRPGVTSFPFASIVSSAVTWVASSLVPYQVTFTSFIPRAASFMIVNTFIFSPLTGPDLSIGRNSPIFEINVSTCKIITPSLVYVCRVLLRNFPQFYNLHQHVESHPSQDLL